MYRHEVQYFHKGASAPANKCSALLSRVWKVDIFQALLYFIPSSVLWTQHLFTPSRLLASRFRQKCNAGILTITVPTEYHDVSLIMSYTPTI